MSRMRNPPYPGTIVLDTVLRPDGGPSVTDFAKRLKLSRAVLSRVKHSHAAVRAESAIRLTAALGGC